MNPAIENLPRGERRALLNAESKRRASGDWGQWEAFDMPRGVGDGTGWPRMVRMVRKNKVFAVLLRPIGLRHWHLAVSSLSGIRPTWHEMQRIKDELCGKDVTAVEVYPPHGEIVDGADMFHIWTVDELPFSIFSGK
jgi:hypothetical protein